MPDQTKPEGKHQELYEKCCDYMTVCESDNESQYHFNYLAAIYKKLVGLPKVPHHLLNLVDKLEEFMLKYDIDRTVIDSATMFKNRGDK
jgi:hypothetical protein